MVYMVGMYKQKPMFSDIGGDMKNNEGVCFLPSKQGVGGSSPSGITNKNNEIASDIPAQSPESSLHGNILRGLSPLDRPKLARV